MRTYLVSLIAAIILSATLAHADSDANRAAADALFQEGRRLAKAGKPAEACPKFEKSLELDDTDGTLLNLADCYEQTGKTASAWTRFNEAADRLTRERDNRAAYARERAARLQPRLARLAIKVGAAARIPGLQITRNNAPVPEALFDVRAPLDPGAYVIVAAAEGHKSWTQTVTLLPAGGETSVEIPTLEAEPPPVEPGTADPTEGTPEEVEATVVDAPTSRPAAVGANGGTGASDKPSSISTRKKVAIAFGIGGAVGIAATVVYGLDAQSTWSGAQRHCDGDLCTAQGVGMIEDAKSSADRATISFIAGAALLAGGIVLLVTDSTDEKPAATRVVPSVGSAGAGVVLSGSF